MNETIFEQVEVFASVLKLDLSAEEFAQFAEDQELSESGMDAVRAVFSYLSEKKQQTTIQTLLKMSRLPTKAPKTFENFDFSLLKGKDVERLRVLPSLNAIYSHRNLAFIGPAGTGKTHLAQAFGYSRFYGEMVTIAAQYFCEDFDQSIPVEVSFVPMMHPTEEGQVFVAEKNTFNYLLDFLRTEFYRGLAIGNAPRRCHNCGKYFLLTAGYNTCYCNNIAPGETDRTCRKVGAHRKEAQGKADRTPAQVVYDRTYNRLKQRKNRKKITVDEWNAAVAKAQELMEQSGCGKLSDEELEKLLNKL